MLAFNNLREEVDLKKARANREKPDCENNFEMCIRAKNNAWLIAKIARGRELYMVLEKANETLLYASDAVEKFSNRCFVIHVFFHCFPSLSKRSSIIFCRIIS